MPVLKLAEEKPTKNNTSCSAKLFCSSSLNFTNSSSASPLTSSTNNPGLSDQNNGNNNSGWCCCGGGKSWCSTLFLQTHLWSSWSFSGVKPSWYKPTYYYPSWGDLWGGGGAKNEGTQLTSPTSSSKNTKRNIQYSSIIISKFHPLKFHHLIRYYTNSLQQHN